MKNIYVLESFTGIQFTFHINVSFCFTLPLELKTFVSNCSHLGAKIIPHKYTSK